MSLNFFSQVELVARATQAPATSSSQRPNARDLVVSVLTEAKQVVNPKLQELVGFRGRDVVDYSRKLDLKALGLLTNLTGHSLGLFDNPCSPEKYPVKNTQVHNLILF